MLFVETSTFTKELPRHFDDDTYATLQAFLCIHPDAGEVIRGTGGIRKIRWTMPGRGKTWRKQSRLLLDGEGRADLPAHPLRQGR